jgi:hypothetical protein
MNLIYFTSICLERRGKAVINLSQGGRCLCRRTAESEGPNRDVSAGTFNSVKISCLMCIEMQSASNLTRVARNNNTVDVSAEGSVCSPVRDQACKVAVVAAVAIGF